MKWNFLLLCVTIGMMGCSPRQVIPSAPSIEGKWKIAVQQTLMTQADQGGKTYTTTINENEWQMDANRSVPAITYLSTGKYHTDYYDYSLQDSVHILGGWRQVGDTLIAWNDSGGTDSLVSKLTFSGSDQVELEAHIDTDADGKKDDAIIAILKRVE